MKNLFKQSDEEKNRIRGLHLTESQDKRITSVLNEQKAGEFEGKPIPSPTTPEGKELLKKALHSFVEFIDNKEGAPGNFNIFLCNSATSASAKEAGMKKAIDESGTPSEELKKFPPKLIHMYLCSSRDASKGNWKNGEYQWDHLDTKFPEFFGAEEEIVYEQKTIKNERITSVLNEQGENIWGDPIYHIPGDRTWEYTVIEGDYWHTRKQGKDKWTPLGKTGDKKWLEARCKLDKHFPQARPSQEDCQIQDVDRPDVVYEIVGDCKCQETTDPNRDKWYKTYEECMSACTGSEWPPDVDIIDVVEGDDWFIDIDIPAEYGNDCDRIKACLKYTVSLEQNFVNKGRWFEFIDCMKGKESKTERKGCDGCPEWVNAGPYISITPNPHKREIDSPHIQECIKKGGTNPVY